MTSSGFRVSRTAVQKLTIELLGALDEEIALCCERETRADLAATAEGSLRVLWDLSSVIGYSIEARGVIVRLQRFLARKAQRTAYIAPDATPRSLALWAARMGDEAGACIAADRAGAEAWLSGLGSSNKFPRAALSLAMAKKQAAG
jgi:hypothetical protein